MSYKRVYYARAVYHVIFRGNNRQDVLKFESDKMDLLNSIGKYQERKDFKVFGFVFMDNHVHMLIEVGENHNISNVMQAILLSFSAKYRRKYAYVGYVWQGRFQSKPVLDEGYMEECLKYFHHNPVKAGLVRGSCDYIFSSARFYEGIKNNKVHERLELSRYGDTSVRSRDVSRGYLETV